jgi:hypothetical protein
MSQPYPDRYKSRGRKERTPAQLAVLAQAREKAKLVIAERAKLNALAKKEEPGDEAPPPEAEPEDPSSENEDIEPRLPSPKYRYINGMYIKIK